MSKIYSDLKLGWLLQLGIELKGMVCQIFEMNGTTLGAVQRIEERLQGWCDAALTHNFTFEDALGRVTQIDMVYVSSWDAFEGMLEACFRDYPGHDKVAKKDYVFQDQKTSKELQRSIPWSRAILPGQHVNMSLIFWADRVTSSPVVCPRCSVLLGKGRAYELCLASIKLVSIASRQT